jgi:hypothetical protein
MQQSEQGSCFSLCHSVSSSSNSDGTTEAAAATQAAAVKAEAVTACSCGLLVAFMNAADPAAALCDTSRKAHAELLLRLG